MRDHYDEAERCLSEMPPNYPAAVAHGLLALVEGVDAFLMFIGVEE